jgi:hypothetical protein
MGTSAGKNSPLWEYERSLKDKINSVYVRVEPYAAYQGTEFLVPIICIYIKLPQRDTCTCALYEGNSILFVNKLIYYEYNGPHLDCDYQGYDDV